jgi:hypothetical protein
MRVMIKKGMNAVAMAALLLGSVAVSTPALAKGKSGVLKPIDDGCNGCGSLKGKTGWIIVNGSGKAVDVPEGTPGAVQKGKSGVLKPNDDGCNGCGPLKGKTGWIIISVAGIAAVGGIIAATGGGKPKSP